MADDGRLRPNDLVWESGTPEWVGASGRFSFAAAAPPPLPPLPRASAAAAREPLGARVSRDLAAFEPAELLPLARVGDPEVLGVPATWLLLAFGLAPLFVGAVVEDPAVRVRLFRLLVGAAWAVFLAAALRAGRAAPRLGIAAFSGGGLLAALLLTLLPGVPPLSWLLALAEPSRPFALRLLGHLLADGLVQEGLKLALLLLLARLLGGLEDAADGVYAGLLLGAGFGLWEAAVTSGWSAPRDGGLLALVREPTEGLEAIFVAGLARALAAPPLHAAWGAIAGYFAGLAAQRKAPAVLILGLSLAALLHALTAALRADGRGLAAFLAAALSLLALLAFRRGAEILSARPR